MCWTRIGVGSGLWSFKQPGVVFLHLSFASVKVDLCESSQVDVHVTEVGACSVEGPSLWGHKLLAIGVVVVKAECPFRFGNQH